MPHISYDYWRQVVDKKLQSLACVAACVGMLFGFVSPAAATTSEGDQDAISAVAAAAPEVLADLGNATVREDTIKTVGSAATVAVPVDASEGISIDGRQDLELTLPFATTSDEARMQDGVPVFDNNNGSESVPVVHVDGSLQVATVINDETAPQSFKYSLGVPGAVAGQKLEDGGILFTDASGVMVAAILAPWARDANGVAVSTHYELDGTDFVQVVDHRGAGLTYPIVADPWLGQDLFGKVHYGTYKGQDKVSIAKTFPFGQAMHVPSNFWIFTGPGWSELNTKDTRDDMKKKDAMHAQYDCHVMGGYFNAAGETWDFELWRPNLKSDRDWTYNVARHRCNWKDSLGTKDSDSSS